ncbi:outer membrane protein, multidrug efflux system [Noviherbaspirillum humi]|uniref:Outer membrane protein, multidrug efflux system n=1 Tax=Noviherbaspirillum humi TaxID=1688639 RepID=A0A239ECW3_9BURK|nr:efflux transporter outer membrane subunit [Noviherbaspirillum humi]SNS42447.1 outer membrane protein, multidrug efflux system [Noviherbaspirillum humi]
MLKQITLSLLAAGVLGGCSLAPTLQRPEAPVAATFPQEAAPTGIAAPATPAANAGTPAADIGWQDFFPDRRLQAFIAAALDNNRDLRTAALRIEEARAQYNIQSADLLPTLNAAGGVTRSRTPGELNASGRPILTTGYQVGLSLTSFELDFFGRVRSLNQAALAQYLATEEAARAARISLVAETAKAYLAERSFAEQHELARQTLQGRENGYRLAQQRFEVGASSALDLRQNETLVLTARATLATLARQRAQAINALTLLVGRPLDTIGDLPAPQPLSGQNIVNDIPAGLPSDLLVRRPDIRAAEQRLVSANANIGAARAAFFPRISLTAAFGTASTALSGLFSAGSGNWSFGPQLLLPIFDSGRNQGNLDLAQVRTNLAVVDYEKTIQTAFREVSDALTARGYLEEQIEAQRAVQVAQADRLKLADQRFRNGISSSLDVLDAERELFSAQQSLVQAQLLRLTNSVDLYRSLGGGLKSTTNYASQAR